MAKPKNIDWTIQGLGKEPDRDIAKRLGVANSAIHHARTKLGIPPFKPLRRPKLSQRDLKELGKISDIRLSRKLGVSAQYLGRIRRARGVPSATGYIRHGIDWDAQPLGEIPDLQIAQRLGCSVESVCKARQRRFIPRAPVSTWKNYEALKHKQIPWDKEPIRGMLGKVTDKELATALGVSTASVWTARTKRGIPSLIPGTPRRRAKRISWTRETYETLWECVVRALLESSPLEFRALYQLVKDDFGSCPEGYFRDLLREKIYEGELMVTSRGPEDERGYSLVNRKSVKYRYAA